MRPVINTTSDEKRPDRSAEVTLSGSPVLLSCILVLPQDAAPILALLKRDNPNSGVLGPARTAIARDMCMPELVEDSWLEHSEAAKYLGVAKSTLYHYACEERIESRKLGRRLEYRRSTLDNFKEQQIRPARRSCRAKSIIAAALGSGK